MDDRRLSLRAEAGDLFRQYFRFTQDLTKRATDLMLTQLVRLRVSQINGCGFCVELHTRAGSSAGITQEQLDALETWADSDLFDDTQRVALRLAEALTMLTTLPPDEVAAARLAAGERLSDTELAHLLFVIGDINQWNRLMISARV